MTLPEAMTPCACPRIDGYRIRSRSCAAHMECLAAVGPVPKLDGERFVCIKPTGHDMPHTSPDGTWWEQPPADAPTYRPCAGCDSVGESCRAIQCPAVEHPMPNQPRPDNPARQVRVEDDLWHAAGDAADTLGTTRSEVVREALRRLVARARSEG